MSQKHLSRQRMICAAGITLAMLGHSQFASAQEAVQSADSQTVSRDADTGKLRASTPAEINALKAASAARAVRVSPKPVQQKFHRNGAGGMRLTDDFMSSSVAVRQPDGTLAEQCVDAHDASGTVAVAHVHTNQVEK